MKTTPGVLIALCAAVGLTLSACGSAGGTFDLQDGTPVTCLHHQPDKPGTAYTGGARANTGLILRMMRFYTANGRKPYCDAKPPTVTDRRWADLYVTLGATRSNVAPILDH